MGGIRAWNGGHAARACAGAGKLSSSLRRLARSGRSAFDTTGPCRARGGDGGVWLPPTTCKVSDDTQLDRPASGDTPRTNCDSSESSERARLRSKFSGSRAAGRSATPSNNLAAAVNNASCGRASKFGTAAARARLTSSSDDTFLAGGGCAALLSFLKYFCAWERTWMTVRVPTCSAMRIHLRRPYFSRPSTKRACSCADQRPAWDESVTFLVGRCVCRVRPRVCDVTTRS